MSASVEIKLKKVDKVYHEGEKVSGLLVISSNSDLKHDGITLIMEGYVNLQLSSKNVGIIEAFYNSVKPIQLVSVNCEVSGPGRIPAGCTQIPFEVPLQPKQNRELYETYHGVFINISYSLKCDIKRSFLSKDLQKTQQFLVQHWPKVIDPPKPISFSISPVSLSPNNANVPNFLIKGKFDSTRCSVSSPLTGYLSIDHCAVAIKSVELQLVRVETCGCAEGYAREGNRIRYFF
ncbi:vacuolar protein sorting 26 related [Holotrichia oblita]|uniref:Vacuolar protein sorting 26 related n=2 Tax=Holotrichia oblita TaxID=644536 RepID=A0ACB9TVU3_HOLOL|nr:vacuolar protein sorting 26 related [Holotrichia oblita]KAI4470882.1 vacuolar protein sorting 26 related [Holotrichia oblita]